MRATFTLIALLTFACSDPIPGPAGPAGPQGPAGVNGKDGAVGPVGPQGGSTVKSGTRLKARVARSEDGASQFLGWWDSELGVECERNLTTARCLPIMQNSNVFMDDECRVGAMGVSSEKAGFGHCLKPDGTRGYFPPGELLFEVYELVDDACVLSDANLPDGWSWHGCGDLPEIPIGDFAAMPESVEDL